MDLGQWVVIFLSAFMVAWYFGASIFNRRRGIAAYHWLRRGLEQWGKITEAHWIGSSGSGGRLIVGKSAKPFGRVEVTYLLESREFFPLWVFNHLRGKRDEVILKASLRSAPKQEVEVGRVEDRKFPGMQMDETKPPFEGVPAPEGFKIISRGHGDNRGTERLRVFLDQDGAAVRRISLQRKTPHLVLRAGVKSLIDSSAESFFVTLQAWLLG